MEDSCPATPLVLSGRNSKSPLQVGLMSPESDGIKSPSPGSPDSRCVICLGRLQNKSFTDSCLHQFCFQCLLQWSKIKAECPLCKQPFKSIIHNVRSNLDYDQYHVEHGEPRYVLSDLMHPYNFDLIPVDRRFRYRSTMTREYFRELAESFLAHTRRIPGDSYQINPLVPVDPAPAPSVRRSNRVHAKSSRQRARMRGTSDFRRNVYAQDLWVQDLADISGRYRECSPQFYRDNPAQIHRIIPWLNREVNVLLNSCESQSQEAYVLSRIVHLLTHHPIRSREFREEVHTYFGDRTDHFIHELYTFARSVYDIAGFDQNAVYGTNPNYATEVQEISSSSDNNDSDIEVIEPIKSEEKPSRHGLRKLLLKRAEDDASRSDEPVAGPSGVSSRRVSGSIDVCESDSEEVKVLDYVKPEPIVVTLSSGEEGQVYSDLDTSNGEYAEVIRSDSRLRRSSSPEDEKRSSRNRSGKGKCKSNGFGLKGKQKHKYIKSKKRKSRSRSRSRSRSTSNSTIGSGYSTISGSGNSSTTSTSSTSFTRSKKCRSTSSLNTRCSQRSCSKLKKKKSKKKPKKKMSYKSSHKRHKSTSDAEKTEKRKQKRVKSCVIVPNWSCDSSPSSHVWSGRCMDEPNRHKSYWSIALNDGSYESDRHKWRESAERSKPKRRHCGNSGEDRSKRWSRESSSSSDRTVVDNEETTPSRSKRSASYDTLSLPSTSGLLSTSCTLPTHSSAQDFINSD